MTSSDNLHNDLKDILPLFSSDYNQFDADSKIFLPLLIWILNFFYSALNITNTDIVFQKV
jgi:hypothetical protein